MHSSGTDALIPIHGDSFAACHLVGAKVNLLPRKMEIGLAAPPALVLSTVFFAPWCSLVQRLPSWRGGDPAQRQGLRAALKSDAIELPFSDEQQRVLDGLLLRLAAHGASQRFAVRSSSPDEDTASASFAGVYEAQLGVAQAALGIGVMVIGMVKRLVYRRNREQQARAERLGIGGNPIVDLGIRMFRMTKMIEAGAFNDLQALGARVQQRNLPADFLAAWDAFMIDFGCRGPGEMDMANQHYADDPMLVLRQMSFMANCGGQFDPDATHQQLARQRQQANAVLSQQFGWARRLLLACANKLIALFGGTRDTPKHHHLMYQHAVRKRLLAHCRKLVEAGRLKRTEQVFELPPWRPEKPGELSSMAVSRGVATGKIKVLHNANEKRVNPGEILVAFTTDPGWTPLFIHAAAVVLEVGGVLQHGAVARDFSKPCVAGIADVLTHLSDGQLVEVDGTAGVVRMITEGCMA